ncbi:hypothetical protein D9M71_793990 [compost metagenome]
MTEFAGHLYQIEPHGMPQLAMAGTGFIEARGFLRAFPPGLGHLLTGALGLRHVARGRQQNGLGVVAQGHSIQEFGCGRDGFGELLPLIDDAVRVLRDEIG